MRDLAKHGRPLRWLAVATTIGMFIVLFAGAAVTNTGSSMGCGRSWPLCDGRWLPYFTLESIIEYSHRLVTGIEGILIAALAIGAWMSWRHRREVRFLVPTMLFFLLLQAGLGAWAVVYGSGPAVMALHFGVSLTAFSSVMLLAVFLYEVRGFEKLRNQPISSGLRALIWGTLVYTYLLVYLGAYVRHTNSELACLDWPLCNGSIYPGFSGEVGIMFAHRLAALIGTLLIGALIVWTWGMRRSRPDLYWGSVASFVFVILQSISGGMVVLSRLNVGTMLLHAALATLLFGALSYICYRTLPLPATVTADEPREERSAPALEVGAPQR